MNFVNFFTLGKLSVLQKAKKTFLKLFLLNPRYFPFFSQATCASASSLYSEAAASAVGGGVGEAALERLLLGAAAEDEERGGRQMQAREAAQEVRGFSKYGKASFFVLPIFH